MQNEPLSIRPRADAVPVEDLVGWVVEGRVRIPKFQRPMRWRASHILELFDSLWLGYPVGNLLFWQRPAGEDPALNLGPLTIHAKQRSDALWVIDGQQRLTALAGVLKHPHPTTSSSDLFALWFDLENQHFVRPRPGEDLPAAWLPMNRVLDAVSLGEWWSDNQALAGQTDLYRVALQLGRRVRESKLPIYIVETPNPDALKIIFARLNTSGVAMRETEVFNALHTLEGTQNPLDVLAQTCREARMGTLEENWRLRCLLTVAGEGLDTPPRREIEGYRSHVPGATAALSLALDFLKNEGHIPHLRALPYRLPVVALVRFFHNHPAPSPRSLVLLRRWLWRGIVNSHHRDTGNPQLRWLTRDIDQRESDSVRRMLENCGTVSVQEIRAFAEQVAHANRTFNAAETKVTCALLAAAGPRRTDNGEALDAGQLLDDLGPGSLQKLNEGRDDRILHPFLDDPVAALNAADPQIQRSHHWDSADPTHARRVETLSRAFSDLLLAWCEPDMPDVIAFTDLLADLGEE